MHPVQADPDSQLIDETRARSAILYGPAGTSKTALARLVAAAIGWNYLPIYASHFVKEGLPNVQARADWIFSRLMELDHCVVLFDEIDELVREREEGSDAFGRFLTTSMLPRIAELWRQGRIIYFVATNLLKVFDPAITRSQRFDLKLFVAPPSYESKRARLQEVLGKDYQIDVRKEEIDESLGGLKSEGKDDRKDESLSPILQLAKFVLLRWDQIDELAYRLTLIPKVTATKRISCDDLKAALEKMAEKNLASVEPYLEFFRQCDAIGRDFGRRALWRLRIECTGPPLDELQPSGKVIRVEGSDEIWFETPGLDLATHYSCEHLRCSEGRPGEFRISRT